MILADAEQTGNLSHDAACGVEITVSIGRGAASEVLGVHHRPTLDVTGIADYFDVLAAIGRELS
jgi:hypothetical protein